MKRRRSSKPTASRWSCAYLATCGYWDAVQVLRCARAPLLSHGPLTRHCRYQYLRLDVVSSCNRPSWLVHAFVEIGHISHLFLRRHVFVHTCSRALALTCSCTQESSSSSASAAASSSSSSRVGINDVRNLEFSEYTIFGEEVAAVLGLRGRTRSEKQAPPPLQYGRELTTLLESRRSNGERMLACTTALVFADFSHPSTHSRLPCDVPSTRRILH